MIKLIKEKISSIARLVPLPKPRKGASLCVKRRVQMDGYSCGAVAGYIAASAIYPGKVSYRRIFDLMQPCPRNGTPVWRMERALKKAGVEYRKVEKRLSFNDIVRAIDMGFPIVTALNYNGAEDSHWVVIYGYCTNKTPAIYIANPEHGTPHRVTFRRYRARYSEDPAYMCWGRE